jgi:hypothetical protein
MEDSREAWALAPRWRGEQRWHMDGPTPSLSTWTPGPSTTRPPASPTGSLPHQRQPAAGRVADRCPRRQHLAAALTASRATAPRILLRSEQTTVHKKR